MVDLLGIARTGIMAANAGLETTSHNISNTNSEGYHKQRVELSALNSVRFGTNRFGEGVQVSDVTRLQNEVVSRQRREVESDVSSLQQFEAIGTQVSEMFGESGYHLDEALNAYFSAVRESADNPASIPLRTVVLNRAEELSQRFNGIDDRLARMEVDMGPQIAQEVANINDLGDQLAQVNKNLSVSLSGENSNDLMDRRDLLLDKLASIVSIDARFSDDGQVSVGIAKGQTIVEGVNHNQLLTEPDPRNAQLLRVSFDNRGGGTDITDAVHGGTLGGLLNESRELLRDTREGLGQLAASLVTEVNSIHGDSIDLDGNAGGNFFEPINPTTVAEFSNSGDALLSTRVINGTELQRKTYELSYDGANWDLADGDGNSLMTGVTLPLELDGIEISLESGAANAGDIFSVSPSLGAASRMAVVVDDPRELALAQPVRAIAQGDNNGDSAVQSLDIVDGGHANLQDPVLIEFSNPPNQYSILDPSDGSVLAAPAAFNSGDTIAYNGWEVTVSGNPAAGDRIALEGNSDGLSGQNMGRIADLQNEKMMAGGSSSIEQMYNSIVGDVGSRVSSAVGNAEAQERVHQILTDRLQSTTGVSLDEEATKLMQYQQLFQASARVIQTAQATFDTIIRAV